MSSLTDRPVHANKVVKRLAPQTAAKTKVSYVSQDKKPVITKKLMGQKTAVSSIKEEKKANISKVKVEVKRERKKSESQQKMVVLQVVKSDCENGDDSNQAPEVILFFLSNFPCVFNHDLFIFFSQMLLKFVRSKSRKMVASVNGSREMMMTSRMSRTKFCSSRLSSPMALCIFLLTRNKQ